MSSQRTTDRHDPPFVRQVAEAAEADLERLPHKTYQTETRRVLHAVLLPWLRRRSALELQDGALHVSASERAELQDAASGGRPFTRWGHHRLAALAGLLEGLGDRGLLRVPKFQFTLKTLRRVAVQPTRQSFDDEARVARALMPALRTVALGDPFDAAPLAVDLAVASILMFEGSLICGNAHRVAAGLRLDDYRWRSGFLRLDVDRAGPGPGRRRQPGRGTPTTRSPQRLFLAAPERALLNAILIGRVLNGALDGGNRCAPLFPALVALMPAKNALPEAFRACWARHAPALADLTMRRFLEAARYHAVLRMPPVCAALLSGRLEAAPMRDADLDDLEAPVGTPVTPRARTPAVESDAADRRARAGRRAALQSRTHPMDDSLAWTPEHDRVYDAGRQGLRRILRSLRAGTPVADARAMAEAVSAAYDSAVAHVAGPPAGRLENWGHVLRYLIQELSAPRVVVNTVLSCLGESEFIVCGVVGDRRFAELGTAGWIEVAAEAIACRDSAASARATRYHVAALHQSVRRYGLASAVVPTIAWATHRELWVGSDLVPVEVLFPWDVDAVRDDVRGRVGPAVARVCDVFIILGGGGGLRASEAAALPLRQVHAQGELLLEIRREETKTDAGERNIPLHWLLPASDLATLHAFFTERSSYGLNPEAPFLATPAYPDGFDADWLAGVVTRSIKRVTGKDLSEHDLRHYFISHFPLRHFVLTHGRAAAAPLGARLLATALYAPEAIARFGHQFGLTAPDEATRVRVAASRTTQPFHQLVFYSGHASPQTTVRSYSHLLDLLQRAHADLPLTGSIPPTCTREDARRALHRKSDRTVRKRFPESLDTGVVGWQALEAAQHRRLATLGVREWRADSA